jgi:hypothetical protein
MTVSLIVMRGAKRRSNLAFGIHKKEIARLPFGKPRIGKNNHLSLKGEF